MSTLRERMGLPVPPKQPEPAKPEPPKVPEWLRRGKLARDLTGRLVA